MNLKHPYEKHLAEKLVQLPPPGDPDQNWQQMKSLLDKNLPRGGGKGPGGSFRWWIAGTVVVAVVAGTWFGGKQLLTKDQRNEAVAGTIKTVNNKTAPSVAFGDKNSPQQSLPNANSGNGSEQSSGGKHDPRGAAYASVTETQGANSSTASGTDERAANSSAATDNTSVPANATANDKAAAHTSTAENSRSSGRKENNAELLANNNKTAVPSNNSNSNNKTTSNRKEIYSHPSNKNSRRGNSAAVNSANVNSVNANNSRGRNTHSNNGNRSNVTPANRNHANAVMGSNPVTTKGKKEKLNQHGKKTISEVIKAENEDIKNRYTYTPVISQPSQPSGNGLQASPVTVKVNYTGSTVISPSGVIQREFTYYTQADLFPEKAQPDKNTARKSSRGADDDYDHMFAFGLSLPLAFPLCDQEALGFNSRGGVNTISDYIPSPHFQYHFNNRTYIQAGLQFSAPQFIRPILLYEYEHMQAPNVMVYNSIYARKLYYFNLPVSVYHSPLRNFYMGAGLQFSSLMSGVAQFQQLTRWYSPGGRDEYVSNYYTKFKNDSLSNRFNTNEIRLLLDINYYWNRFTVGLQYNQAFNNYVSYQVNPGSPYIFDKNKSLQFYLRYNIWEDKKRNKLSKNQSVLTFK